jgi:hypothetical protein
MKKTQLKQKIDEMVKEIVDDIKPKLGLYIESITLAGSYVTGKLSLERPNVNILVFVKPNPSADLYLETGRILYRIGKKYSQYFRVRIDPFPFRFAQPIGRKPIEVLVNLNFYEMADKDLVTWITPDKKVRRPFGAPEPVIQSFKYTRKVVFGTDVLGGMEFNVTHEDILLNVMMEFPGVYRLQLTRAPLTYNVDKDYEWLASEALEIGKSCLASAIGVLLDEESIRQGKHLKLLADKKKMLVFLKQHGSPNLAKWAETILTSRDNFLKVKKDKKKVFDLYRAAYNVLNMIFGIAIRKLFGGIK